VFAGLIEGRYWEKSSPEAPRQYRNQRDVHMKSFRFPALARLALAIGVALGAAGSAALAQTKIVVRTDFKFNGYVSPLALAIAKGFYRDAGFDVAIEQGQGSATTVQTVASGVDTFGLADAATTVLGITAQNVPVKLVAVYNQTGTMGLIYHPDSDWNGDIAALKGKVVISSAGSADAKLLEPTLASAGMKLDDVKLQLVDINARVPSSCRRRAPFSPALRPAISCACAAACRPRNTFPMPAMDSSPTAPA
jgi:NitT/TauT family transport system substrate-binding protein